MFAAISQDGCIHDDDCVNRQKSKVQYLFHGEHRANATGSVEEKRGEEIREYAGIEEHCCLNYERDRGVRVFQRVW